MEIKNTLITGKPGIGKSSLIMEIVRELPFTFKREGFFTQEIRNDEGKRIGFKVVSLDGEEELLASRELESKFRVGKYRVNLETVKKIAVETILKALRQKDVLIIIDEIGPMECLLAEFISAVNLALDSKNKVLASIKLGFSPYFEIIRSRRDSKIFLLKRENKENLKQKILKLLI